MTRFFDSGFALDVRRKNMKYFSVFGVPGDVWNGRLTNTSQTDRGNFMSVIC